MNILGVGGYAHDASAALIAGGRIVAAAEEERFTRQKHQTGWPDKAIAFCLKQGGLKASDVDHIAFYWRPWTWDGVRSVGRRLLYLPVHPVFSSGFLLHQLHDTAMFVFHMRRQRSLCGGAGLHYVRHHDTHAGSAFFVSPFDEAAVLTMDSRGEWATSVMYHGKGNRLDPVGRINLPHSIGVLYLCTTNHLGFRTGDEYKIMGLAAYGEPRYAERFRKIVTFKDDGTYRVDTSYFKVQHSPGRYVGYTSQKFADLFGAARKPDDEITQEHKDIAASLQVVLEETVFHVLRGLHERTGSKNLCMVGGVSQNSVMCGKILEQTPFEEVFFQPAGGDNGCALGAAAWVHNQVLGQPRGEAFTSAYLGPAFSDADIEAALMTSKLDYDRPKDVARATAKLIAKGKIVGWFQGRMEWGARALGNRSILADVTNPEMTNSVNRYVKHREDFRPFAPVCSESAAPEFFEVKGASPYMLKVVRTTETAKRKMPAIVHVDGSARLQTVAEAQNPLLYGVLKEMERLKGVPCALNTSFNVKGEPIVCTPEDAIRCWSGTGMDALVLGPFVLQK